MDARVLAEIALCPTEKVPFSNNDEFIQWISALNGTVECCILTHGQPLFNIETSIVDCHISIEIRGIQSSATVRAVHSCTNSAYRAACSADNFAVHAASSHVRSGLEP